MYNLACFKESDTKAVLQFMHDHPFVFLTGSAGSGVQVATQIPVMIEERDGHLYIQGHIMRNTDHHKAFAENSNVLVVFTGPHAYVSATWYSDPKMGSTWNYMSVHVKGKIRFMDDAGLIALMKKLSLRFEGNNTSSPTIFDNLLPEYTSKMLPAIVGFEIKAEHLENVFKLSQNRDEESYRNIIDQLEKKGGDAKNVAEEMRKRMKRIFPKHP